MFKRFNILIAFILLAFGILAQEVELDSTILDQVTITSYSKDRDTALSIDKYQSSLSTLFNRQVSILALNSDNFAQDIRLSVRGFGARSAFGIRGVRMIHDEIPLSSPDGTSNIDELSVYDIYSTDVLTGGLGTIYGNAGGGAILLRTPDVSNNNCTLNSRVTSLGSYDLGLKKNIYKNKYNAYLSLQRQYFNGYRSHSDASTSTFYTKHQVTYNQKFKASYIVNLYNSPLGRDAGGLTIDQADLNPKMANERNVTFDAGEKVRGGHIGAHHIFTFSNKVIGSSTIYAKIRDFEGKIPSRDGGWIDLKRKMYGAIHKISYQASDNFSMKFGHQWEGQYDKRSTFINNNGEKGNAFEARDENLSNNGVFAALNMYKSKWQFSSQIRYDYGEYSIANDDFILNSLNGSLTTKYHLSRLSSLFIQAASTFESPTLNEYAAQANDIKLRAEQARHLELGFNTSISRLNFDVKAFVIDLDHTIIAAEDVNFPGRTIYRNGGSGFRQGLESTVDLQISNSWKIQSALAYNHFSIKSGSNEKLIQPLVPEWKASFLIVYTNSWFEINYLHLFVSKMYLDSQNKFESPNALDAQLIVSTNPERFKGISFGIQINNAYNTLEYSNYRINALGSRYYETASPRQVGMFFKVTI